MAGTGAIAERFVDSPEFPVQFVQGFFDQIIVIPARLAEVILVVTGATAQLEYLDCESIRGIDEIKRGQYNCRNGQSLVITSTAQEGLSVIKPMGVLLALSFVLVLVLCLIPVLWGIVHSIRNRARKTAVVLGIAAVGIVVFDAWAICAVAPKGGRTIAQLELPDGRAFVVRHYRSGWFEYPKVRFYARDTEGVWTSFVVISELVSPNSTSLVLDASAQKVEVPGVGWYRIQDNDFVNPDGSRGTVCQLPQGTKPGEEGIY